MRFAFGKNWQHFAQHIDEGRIAIAQDSLRRLLNRERLDGLTFLDIGCGSGLFSLAALRLGARRVVSFDYDLNSVACTTEIKRRYGAGFDWAVEQGSVLDAQTMANRGHFDVVYSWGVLHHTGDMWRALSLAGDAVAANGSLAIAIYNDQGPVTQIWKMVKRLYNFIPRPAQIVMGNLYFIVTALRGFVTDVLMRRSPWGRYAGSERRGMSAYYDAIDWIGGWPYEAATPEAIFEFYRARGFVLEFLCTRQGPGCNEFTFRCITEKQST